MSRLLITLVLCAHLLLPAIALAQAKDPLNYPLKQYAFVLGMALLGGLASWFNKVRKGELSAGSLNSLIGELCTSALSGLIAFYLCEWMNVPPVLTGGIVGIAGHMGNKALSVAEDAATKWLKRRAGKVL